MDIWSLCMNENGIYIYIKKDNKKTGKNESKFWRYLENKWVQIRLETQT